MEGKNALADLGKFASNSYKILQSYQSRDGLRFSVPPKKGIQNTRSVYVHNHLANGGTALQIAMGFLDLTPSKFAANHQA